MQLLRIKILNKGLSYISDLSRPLETIITENQEKKSRKNEENLNVPNKEKEYTNNFAEVDGQLSMFSDEPVKKPLDPLRPQPTYQSISNFLYKKTFVNSDKVLFKKILSTLDEAIKKRA